MKIFLSWSGELSHQLAAVFRDWLPSVLQYVAPYLSSEDIDKGARWSIDISKELEVSQFGILFITKGNTEAPWINFEAGALSKAIDKARVSPLLFGVKRSQIRGPLLQFQSTLYEEKEVLKLLNTINTNSPNELRLEPSRLEKVFDKWWWDLTDQVKPLIKDIETEPIKVSVDKDVAEGQILEEMLELVRIQHKLLRSPEYLFPNDLVRRILMELPRTRILQISGVSDSVEYLYRIFDKLKRKMDLLKESHDSFPTPQKTMTTPEETLFMHARGFLTQNELKDIVTLVDDMESSIGYLKRHLSNLDGY